MSRRKRKPAKPDQHTELPSVEKLREQFVQIGKTATDLDAFDVQQLCSTLMNLTVIVSQFEHSPTEEEFTQEILEFCRDSVSFLERALQGELDSTEEVESQVNFIDQRWGEYLDLLPEEDRHFESDGDQWAEIQQDGWESEEPEHPQETETLPAFENVSELLSQLEGLPTTESTSSSPPVKEAPRVKKSQQVSEEVKLPVANLAELIAETIDDPEMVSAYADDAQQCLAGMETCLLDLENGKNTVESLRQFCRELHTLKGASGTVGLMKLAQYLHDLETYVEEISRGGGEVQIDPLLNGVDFVRQQLAKILPQGADEAPPPVQASAPTRQTEKTPPESVSPESVSQKRVGETYVRLEASRLDRLMDLLAELVMLRNRRETYVSSLEKLNHEINSCSTRLRLVDTYTEIPFPGTEHLDASRSGSTQQGAFDTKRLTTTITELSKDVGELGRTLQEVVDPLAKDNSTISHLIGNFRTELMELRRQPITGLFRRLHRVARDAGKAENRQIELNLLGQGTRVERALQERLFEPLMHLIRNSVSHGIEDPDERLQAEKPVVGKITLEAWSDATSMYLEIKDDGRGLNEEVLEKKGLELGLIRPGSKLAKEKLWELILQPGFSTKSEVSQIAGRGVGMDVVASQIRSLRGKVTIDSVVGKYTSFRLEIPLSSTIEHAMIVRCGKQLFALPMHAIYGTQTGDQISEDQKVIGLHELLHITSSHSSTQRVITLRQQETSARHESSQQDSNDNLSIVVDAVVGVEEVVVRSLPSLLQNHHCFSGVTLSGEAETVLVLDLPRLSEYALQLLPDSEQTLFPSPPDADHHRAMSKRGLNLQSQKILVVDDSISVRRSLTRKLESHGFEIVEAADGIQGLEKIKLNQFVAVISDIDMPRMNGVEFVSELRRSEKYQEIPVVVLTSRRDDEAIEAMRDLGVRQVFTKPVNDSMMKTLLYSIRFRSKTLEPMTN